MVHTETVEDHGVVGLLKQCVGTSLSLIDS